MTQQINDNLVLIVGKSSMGKSRSLKNLRNPGGVLYLNCEAGKKLPFKSGFQERNISDFTWVDAGFKWAESQPEIHTIVLDTLTFWLDLIEAQMINTAQDTRAAWGHFAQYFKNFMQVTVAQSTKNVIILAHTKDEVNGESIRETVVPVKGSLKNQGIEAYFSQVVATKKVPISELEKYPNDMLHITDRDRMLGYKHVFQTLVTKDSIYERIRGPEDMFADTETYIDNDAQILLDRVNQFYS